jgi:hypothetical protein
MAVTIKSSSAGEFLAYDAGTTTHDLTVNVATGEMLILALLGQGTINSLSESLTNANGLANLNAVASGWSSSNLWVFHTVPSSSITTVTLNVTGFYAWANTIVAQGDNLNLVDVNWSIVTGGAVNAGEAIPLDAGTASRSGYRIATGGGQIPGVAT